MSGARSRRKGAQGERDLANRWARPGTVQRSATAFPERTMPVLVRPLFPEAKRGIGQARSGSEVADVEGTPFWVEVKRRKAINVRASMKQAKDATDGRPPVVVCRWDGDPEDESIVCMRLVDWEELLRSGVRSKFAALAHEEVGPMFMTTEGES